MNPKRRPNAQHVERSGRVRALSAIVTALLCAAPVPGDIGACGQPVQRLDPGVFFGDRKKIDCERCEECGVRTKTCDTACERVPPQVVSFSENCEPLVHDGEVCLRALLAASCDDYATYVADTSPAVPTECNFCPAGGHP